MLNCLAQNAKSVANIKIKDPSLLKRGLILILFSICVTMFNLAKLDDGLDESPTVMVGQQKQKKQNKKR